MIDEQYGNCPPLLSLKYPPRACPSPPGQAQAGRRRRLSGRRVTNVPDLIYDRTRRYFSEISLCVCLFVSEFCRLPVSVCLWCREHSLGDATSRFSFTIKSCKITHTQRSEKHDRKRHLLARVHVTWSTDAKQSIYDVMISQQRTVLVGSCEW